MTAFQLAQYLGAAGTAAFMLYHLALYFRPSLAPSGVSDTKPIARTNLTTPIASPTVAAPVAEQTPAISKHESDPSRCVKAFAYLKEIQAALLEECGVEGERAAQLLEPIAPLLLRQKGDA